MIAVLRGLRCKSTGGEEKTADWMNLKGSEACKAGLVVTRARETK